MDFTENISESPGNYGLLIFLPFLKLNSYFYFYYKNVKFIFNIILYFYIVNYTLFSILKVK